MNTSGNTEQENKSNTFEDEVRNTLNLAGVPIGNEHEQYDQIQRLAWLIYCRDGWRRIADRERARAQENTSPSLRQPVSADTELWRVSPGEGRSDWSVEVINAKPQITLLIASECECWRVAQRHNNAIARARTAAIKDYQNVIREQFGGVVSGPGAHDMALNAANLIRSLSADTERLDWLETGYGKGCANMERMDKVLSEVQANIYHRRISIREAIDTAREQGSEVLTQQTSPPSPSTKSSLVSAETKEKIAETLLQCRKALEYLPKDCLGVTGENVELPTGEAGRMEWPIRDELIDNITKSLAALNEFERSQSPDVKDKSGSDAPAGKRTVAK